MPTLVDIMPSGEFLMEDYYYAGGLPAVLRTLGEHGMLDKDAPTVTGQSMWDNVKDAPNWNTEVIREWDNPHTAQGGIAVLRGNLAPDGAVIKPSAATPALMQHRGRAVVFESIEDYKARIGDDALDVDETCSAGAQGRRPQGLSRHGRGRQHGAAAQGPEKGRARHGPGLGCAHERHRLRHRGAAHLPRGGGRRAAGPGPGRRHDRAGRGRPAGSTSRSPTTSWRGAGAPGRAPTPAMASGYQKLYVDTVLQASEGADLDFLRGCRGAAIPRESH